MSSEETVAVGNSHVSTNGEVEAFTTAMEEMTLSPDLNSKVFQNELIRDRIFDYIFTSDNTSIRTYGLVEHAWLDYITCRLRKIQGPPKWISFEYGKQSKEFQANKEKKYQVQNFLDTWATFPGAGSRVPLFNLNFTQAFDTFMIQSLVKCLTQCGNGLCRLTINLNNRLDNGSNEAINSLNSVAGMNQLDLSNLRQLEVKLPQKDYQLVTQLLYPLLSACKRLVYLELDETFLNQDVQRGLVSEEGSLVKDDNLPNTPENNGNYMVTTSQLLANLLLKNSFPNLTGLSLNFEGRPNNNNCDVISRILDQFSNQITIFRLSGNYGVRQDENEGTYVRFPVMTKLEAMLIVGFHSEHVPKSIQPFPVLEVLKLIGQSSTTMRKWTGNFEFNCVKDLTVEIGEVFPKDADFTLELSQQLHVSYPHLQQLCLSVGNRVEDGSIQNVFQHMTQLRMLSIYLTNTDGIIGTSIWDAIFLGVSPGYLASFVESSREHWNLINLSNFQEPLRSIVNLSRLTQLQLSAYSAKRENNSLISDVSFKFAFMRMPNLVELRLSGRFKASEKIVEEWKQQGRQIST